MSYFKRAQDVIVNQFFEFGIVTTDTLQQFQCVGGEVAGWKIQPLGIGPDGNTLFISQVFDCTTGSNILIGSVAAMPGIDLTGGYFSTGCFPAGDPLTIGTVFIKVDYV